MPAQLVALTAAVAATNVAVAALTARFDRIEDQLALIGNRGVSTINHPIQPRQGILSAPLPPGFPQTLEVLHGMTTASLAPFLAFYGLPLAGTKRNKQRRLAEFLGVLSHFA